MGRPSLEIGTHGRIRLRPLPAGPDGTETRWCAHTLFRDQSGRTKAMRRVGDTQEAALSALKAGVSVAAGQFSGIPLAGAQVKIKLRADATPRRHVLYRFYDSDGCLLYVGISGQAKYRFRDHARMQPWWGEVQWIQIEDHPGTPLLPELRRRRRSRASPPSTTSPHDQLCDPP